MGAETLLHDFSALVYRLELPTTRIWSWGETAMAFSGLSENEFTEHAEKLKKGSQRHIFVGGLVAECLPLAA